MGCLLRCGKGISIIKMNFRKLLCGYAFEMQIKNCLYCYVSFLSSIYFVIEGVTFEDEAKLNFDLPEIHVPYFIHRRPDIRARCLREEACLLKSSVEKCFGYEDDCDVNNLTNYSYELLRCPGESNWQTAKSKDEQIRTFWNQGDFGYIKERLKEMRIICKPNSENPNDSSLLCADHLKYCYANNIMFNFRHLQSNAHTNKYREDVIQKGDIAGGRCQLNAELLRNRADHHSPLQSWAAELKHFQVVKDFHFNNCDIVYEKPVILIKLDAGISMYHHFCDFVNMYASQHLNGSFHRDVHIIQWDTSGTPYQDYFEETWKVFTDLPLIHLRELDGKKVCFRQAMFPLLARMIFGVYYNMPLIDGCEGSGLFHAFSEHIRHRLKLSQIGPLPAKRLRVTFLSRNTNYRRILNENELISGLKTMVELEVTAVDYAKLPFLLQANRSVNTDIFIGIHGSGLTHLLLLPDWAAVFEIYNCEDPNCYSDLARLRGASYFTWERVSKLRAEDEGHHPTLGAHAKFTNYQFDLEEFLRLISKMVRYVYEHKAYKEAVKSKIGSYTDEL